MNGELIARLLMVLTGFALAMLGVIVFIRPSFKVALPPILIVYVFFLILPRW